VFRQQLVEVVVALKKLGEELTAEEQGILDAAGDAARHFEEAVEGDGVGEGAVMSLAGKGLRGARATADAVRVVSRLSAAAGGGKH
jgi:Beta-catenin-interacting protein ICAT